MDSTRPPLPPGCRLIQRLARYIMRLIREKLFPGHPPTPWPDDIPFRLQAECHQIVAVVVKAFLNTEQVKWSVNEYKSVKDSLTEAELLARFPSPFVRQPDGTPYLTDQSCTIVDHVGRILVWYLPNIISKDRQEIILDAIRWLSFDAPVSPFSCTADSFRTHKGSYSPSGSISRSGVATFASCWPVRTEDHGPARLRPSTTFDDPDNGGLVFLEKFSESLGILGAILAAVNPAQYEAGLDVLAALSEGTITTKDRVLLQQVLEHWSTPFTAFSIVNNRDTRLHRDPKTPFWAFDLLYTGGRYHEGRFEVPSLGLRCRYNPGTVVALLTSVFAHGISPVEGSRHGISQFFRQVMVEQIPFSRLPRCITVEDYSHYFNSSYYLK